jgi:hypothetical protein
LQGKPDSSLVAVPLWAVMPERMFRFIHNFYYRRNATFGIINKKQTAFFGIEHTDSALYIGNAYMVFIGNTAQGSMNEQIFYPFPGNVIQALSVVGNLNQDAVGLGTVPLKVYGNFSVIVYGF